MPALIGREKVSLLMQKALQRRITHEREKRKQGMNSKQYYIYAMYKCLFFFLSFDFKLSVSRLNDSFDFVFSSIFACFLTHKMNMHRMLP